MKLVERHIIKPEDSRYKTKDGMLINADVNGSLNILRKHLNVVCDDIICPADRGLVMNPLKINFHKNVE